MALQDGKASVCAGGKCTQLLERGHTANITREGGVIQIKRDLVPTWTFASVCSGNSALCSPLPALTRKASLTAPALGDKAGKAKGAITRFCPDGQPMRRQRLRAGQSKCVARHLAATAERPITRSADHQSLARCIPADAEHQQSAVNGQLAGRSQPAISSNAAPVGADAEA